MILCSIALVFVVGCADGPYRITVDGSTYYTKQIERGKDGKIKFTDALNNAEMTLYDQPGTFAVKTEKLDSNNFDTIVARLKSQHGK
jgi:hypothetical protein